MMPDRDKPSNNCYPDYYWINYYGSKSSILSMVVNPVSESNNNYYYPDYYFAYNEGASD